MTAEGATGIKGMGMAGLLSATYHFMMSRIMDRLAVEGYQDLSKTQLHVLVRFDMNGMTLREISQRVQVSVHVVSNVVKMLATKGYVAKIEESDSLEEYKYGVIERGQDVISIVENEQEVVENAWRHHLGEQDLAAIGASLERLFEATRLVGPSSD